MRKELEDELVMTLMPYIDLRQLEDVKMKITMVVGKYDISKTTTELTVYEGDVNDLILKKFLSAKIAAGLSQRTIKYYAASIRATLEHIGKPYMDVTADDIRLWLAYRIHRDGVSKQTADNERRNLSAFYGWLQKEEILLKNPMNKVDSIKITKRRRKAYTNIDLEKIRLGCQNSRERAIVEVFASTWCRVTEVRDIKLSDIDGNKIEVHGKGDKYRTVYLNARALLAVSEYMKERKDNSPYLFPGANFRACDSEHKQILKKYGLKKHEWWKIPELVAMDKIPDASILENTVRKIGKRVGVEKVHPHRFRRTGATMALRQGMPLLTVSKLLGHESVETTQIYLDISDQELEQAHEKFVN